MDDDCPSLSETGFCYKKPPPNNCEWSTWFEWGSWSATCGYATRTRERVLLESPDTYVTDVSQGASSVTLNLTACGTIGSLIDSCTEWKGHCPQDCVMSKWGKWSPCVFPGIRERHRKKLKDNLWGGAPCPPCVTEIDQCELHQNEPDPSICVVQPCLHEVASPPPTTPAP
jgi:hypothetical protein